MSNVGVLLRRGALLLLGASLLAAAVVTACGSSSSSTTSGPDASADDGATSDGANPGDEAGGGGCAADAACPSTEPASGSACGCFPSTGHCSYGCSPAHEFVSDALCVDGGWQIYASAIACPAPDAGGD